MTPICDKHKFNINELWKDEWMVVDLEVAEALEIKLGKALETLKRLADEIQYEFRLDCESYKLACRLIKELEEE